jgi:dihydrodipicolinate synthase/N-acetylneuraminate lyase
MDRNSVTWSGPMPAVTTPFYDDGRINDDAFAHNVERLLRAGATGIVAGGCTGEFWALTHEERKRLYAIAREAMAGRGTLIVATGAVTVQETVALSRAAEQIGCDGALILPPYFVKLTDDEIFAHYADVCGQVGLPVILYNIPGNAVNALTPPLVARLAELDRIVAIKESSGDWNNYYGTVLAVQSRLRVFCGPSSVFGVPAVELGADGTIDCFPNMWLPGGLDLFYAPARGEHARAAEVQAVGRKLTDLCTSGGRTLYPATKAAMDMLGLPGGGKPRAPLRALAGEPLAGLETGLKALGLL